jgi:ABC-type nickel/cobalt efflux system permease component RcnA
MNRLGRLLAILATVGTALLAVAGPASAHPLGNFSINHYAAVYVSSGSVDVDLVVDLAELPSIEAMRDIDTDGDRILSAAEAQAARGPLCTDKSSGLQLQIGGRPIGLDLWAAGLHQQQGAGGLTTLRLVCELRAESVAVEGAFALSISDTGDAGRLGWREIVVRGDGLLTEPAGSTDDVTSRLTNYPTDLLTQPLDERSLDVTLRPGGPPVARAEFPDASPLEGPAGAAISAPERSRPGTLGELNALPPLGELSLGAALVGILLAAVAGAGHALSPGHGKTIMAAYLVGTNGSTRHALLLGAAVTLSHTLGVLVLAAVVLLAADMLPPEQLYPILTAVSGAAVTVIGAGLLVGCLRRFARSRNHDHDHPHEHVSVHRHGWRVHSHDVSQTADADAPSLPGRRGLIAIGVAGGLVPSPAALVLLLAAIAAGQPAYGLVVALSFGVGMAAVLSGIGLLLVHGRRRLSNRFERSGSRLPAAQRLSAAMPWAIAIVITASGVLLTSQALVTQL